MWRNSPGPHVEIGRPPIRVLHVVSTFAVKTDTIWLSQLLARLSRERIASSIVCMYGGDEMRTRFDQLGIPTVNLNAPRAVSPGGLWRLTRLIRGLRAQVVHTHLLRADLYGGLAARLAGVPAVLTTRYAIYPYARAVARRCDGILDRACRMLATDALCVSEAVRQDLMTRLRWPAARAHTIRTGLDFDAWHADPAARTELRKQWSVPDGSPLVVTVARLSHEKGLEVLIEAADLVRRQHPNVRFVCVGDGPLAATLARQIAERGLTEHVRLAGFHRDIPSVLSAADFFVLPSHMEGMPNAVLEAFAAGLPVVASAAGGLVEAVENERTGLLVPARDANALAIAINRLVENPHFAQAMAKAGQVAARERFSIGQVAAQYEALYSRLLEKIGPRTPAPAGIIMTEPWSRSGKAAIR